MIGEGPDFSGNPQLAAGDALGDYDILLAAGAGGMGVVYKASQRSLNRMVALKVIRSEIGRRPEFRERFLREARLAASVDHPNVVSVYDVGEDGGRLFLAMQWIEGQDLGTIIRTGGRLAPERAVGIATQVAAALDAVHSVAGLIHRDVKPANVLVGKVDARDHAYLTDFGVAKISDSRDGLTQTGSIVGTTGYLSPEQIRGHEPGPRSDIYALGCLFFEALTGIAPYRGENDMAVRWAHANDPRPIPSAVVPAIGTRYDQFIQTALAVDPNQRFGSGRDFADALLAAQLGAATGVYQSPATPPPTPTYAPTAIGPSMPLTPPMTPTPAPVYPVYAYGPPTPPPATTGRSGSPLALILLGLVALAGIAVGALAAAGVFSHSTRTSTNTITATAKTGLAHATAPRAATVKSKARASKKPSGGSSSNGSTSGQTICGQGLAVGPDTSCPFAQNVQQAYASSGGGTTNVLATSPVTNETYTMHCTAGSTVVCSGGNNALVYISAGSTAESSSPAAAPQPSSSSVSVPQSPGALTSCGPNVSVGPATTCPFGENVLSAYSSANAADGQQTTQTIEADSPVTGKAYTMTCITDGTTVGCTGGNNAYVTFPLSAG